MCVESPAVEVLGAVQSLVGVTIPVDASTDLGGSTDCGALSPTDLDSGVQNEGVSADSDDSS